MAFSCLTLIVGKPELNESNNVKCVNYISFFKNRIMNISRKPLTFIGR